MRVNTEKFSKSNEMNPQHIVFVGLVLLGLGITISAIDPLKPEPELDVIWLKYDGLVDGDMRFIDIYETGKLNGVDKIKFFDVDGDNMKEFVFYKNGIKFVIGELEE